MIRPDLLVLDAKEPLAALLAIASHDPADYNDTARTQAAALLELAGHRSRQEARRLELGDPVPSLAELIVERLVEDGWLLPDVDRFACAAIADVIRDLDNPKETR